MKTHRGNTVGFFLPARCAAVSKKDHRPVAGRSPFGLIQTVAATAQQPQPLPSSAVELNARRWAQCTNASRCRTTASCIFWRVARRISNDSISVDH
jgi:hypothetical protein